MNAQVQGGAPRFKQRLHQGLRKLRSLGWPVLTGMVLATMGLAFVLMSHHLRTEHKLLQQRNTASERTTPKPIPDSLRAIPAILPSTVTYTTDLARIFDIAKDQGIAMGSGDYRDADRVSIPVDIRLVDLRFEESYTKLKEFVATVLNTMPHVAVEDLRIERKDNLATRHRVTLKLALVYRADPGKLQVPAELVRPGQKPTASPGSLPL
jgi:hypothetical protein